MDAANRTTFALRSTRSAGYLAGALLLVATLAAASGTVRMSGESRAQGPSPAQPARSGRLEERNRALASSLIERAKHKQRVKRFREAVAAAEAALRVAHEARDVAHEARANEMLTELYMDAGRGNEAWVHGFAAIASHYALGNARAARLLAARMSEAFDQ